MIEPVCIEDCRISVGQYLRYTLSLYLNSYWWIYALPLAVCLALSVLNINFIFVAIVLLFLVFTMILYIVVLYYGLVPECRYSIMQKDVVFFEDGIDLILKKPVDTDTENQSEPEYKSENVFFHRKHIKNIFKGMEMKGDCLLLLFKQPKFSFIALPYNSFRDKNDIKRVLDYFNIVFR